MQSIFPLANTHLPNDASSVLCSFNAGKMKAEKRSSGVFLISPEPQKGKVSVLKKDGLVHFQWSNRETGEIVDDIILVEGDAKYEKVDTGRADDRVYLLESNSGMRCFYWLQYKDKAQDEENTKKMVSLVSHPQPNVPSTGAGGGSASTSLAVPASEGTEAGAREVVDSDTFMRILNSLNNSNADILRGAEGSAGADGTPGNEGYAGEQEHEDDGNEDEYDENAMHDDEEDMSEDEMMRRAIEESMKEHDASSNNNNDHEKDNEKNNNNGPNREEPPSETRNNSTGGTDGGAGTGSGSGSGLDVASAKSLQPVTADDLQRAMNASQQTMQRNVRLETIFKKENVRDILSSKEYQQRLLPLLPENLATPTELDQTIHTPQFRQCLAMFTNALESNDITSIVANLGLNASLLDPSLLQGDPVKCFLRALQASVHEKKVEKK